MDVLRTGQALLLFPEGTRVHGGELGSPRPGVGMLAVVTNTPVVPVFITGSNEPRKWLFRLGHVRVRFGPPRTWRELAGADADLEPGRALYTSVGAGVMREIAALKTRELNPAARGAA